MPFFKTFRFKTFNKIIFFPLLFGFVLCPLFSNNVSLAAEITRLEKLSFSQGAVSQDRYNAFLALARLYRLSGSKENALKTYDEALKLFPGDGCFLLEQGRLLISLGEYEKAVGAVAGMLALEKEYALQGRLVLAQLEAFRSGNIRPLETLAGDPEFSAFRSGIYYTLWRLTDNANYKARLAQEFGQSPEAKIASGAVTGEPSPLWLLFPGRDAITLETVSVAVLQTQTPVTSQTVSVTVLQTGIFSHEDNARSMVERLRRAGFESQIRTRVVNGNNHWAVTVQGGNDAGAMMKKLKEAGFDSFPVR